MDTKDRADNLEEILRLLEKPLRFASKNNFSALHAVKGLDSLIPSLARKARMYTDDHNNHDLLTGIAHDFSGFQAVGQEEQKNIIRSTLSRLEKLVVNPTARRGYPFSDSHYILNKSIQEVKGIGPKLCEAFERKNITTIEDLIYFLPRTYIDRRSIRKIASIQPGMDVTIAGKIISAGTVQIGRRKKLFEVLINDGTQTLSAKWFTFNAAYLNMMKKKFSSGREVMVSGPVSEFRFNKEMHHPEIDLLGNEDSIESRLKIEPVYPLTEGVHQKTIRKIMQHVVGRYIDCIPDILPRAIASANRLVPIQTAFKKVHFPDTDDDVPRLISMQSAYHRRIVFDEFFQLQVVLALKKKGVSIEQGISFSIDEKELSGYVSSLPFTLTGAQSKSLSDILTDMQKSCPMNRLVQGDVGSGKTVVAFLAARAAIADGFQAAFMAPTEILAEQHYATIQNLCRGTTITPALLTSSQTKPEREASLSSIRSAGAQLVIGTHALIQEGVDFHRLGLAVIDEQHKFGVMQRAEIKRKGTNPDILVMTATPIPRTLGLTVYGDLDVSIIDELPPGRKPVVTDVFHENKRDRVYEIVREELQKNNQTFIVYPLVEESEKLDLMDATKMAAHLQQDVFPEYRVGLVHGKMPAHDKDDIMRQFQSGAVHILVATTVIEVGIDVPNASLMIIEHAERFGLSQLHQLRGRVGRGTADSRCILLAQYKKSDEARQRLAVMKKTNDGFKIAEEDFNIRGPGDIMGTRQSGLPDFRIAHIGRDIKILVEARKAAFALVDRDPELRGPEHQLLKQVILDRWRGRFELAGVG